MTRLCGEESAFNKTTIAMHKVIRWVEFSAIHVPGPHCVCKRTPRTALGPVLAVVCEYSTIENGAWLARVVD